MQESNSNNQSNNGFKTNQMTHDEPYQYNDLEKELNKALNSDNRINTPMQPQHQNPYLPQENIDAELKQAELRRQFEENNKSTSSTPKREKVTLKKEAVDLRDYVPFNINVLPCFEFYPMNTIIYIKACKVKDIQNYSMVDDSNSLVSQLDLVTKLNALLENNVVIKFIDGTIVNYKSIYEPDKVPLVYGLRELTFSNGKPLVEIEKCSCGLEYKIPLTTKNMRNVELPSDLRRFYTTDGYLAFHTEKFGVLKARPSTIGLQQAIYEYCGKRNAESKDINISALEVLPFFLHKDDITADEIEIEINKYENIDYDLFVIMYKIAQKLKTAWGVKTAYVECECGLEVHTEKVFPTKPSTLLINDGGLDEFVI